MPAAENSKELCTPAEPAPDPGECGSAGPQIAGAGGAADGVSSGKGDAMPSVAVAVAPPTVDATCRHSELFFTILFHFLIYFIRFEIGACVGFDLIFFFFGLF